MANKEKVSEQLASSSLKYMDSSQGIFRTLRNTCGRRCLTIFRTAIEETKRCAGASKRKAFLLECAREGLTPRSLWFHLPGRFDSDFKLKWRVTLGMMRREISFLSGQIRSLMSDRDMRLECLRRIVEPPDLLSRVMEYIEVCSQRSSEREEEMLRRRLARLRGIYGRD